MTAPFERLAGLDKTIHEPARLAICTALAACERADFVYLQRLTGLSKGNLSAHLRKLEDAGVVEVSKGFDGRIPRTQAALTPEGRQAFIDYWIQLDKLRTASEEWSPQPDSGVPPRQG